MYLYAVLIAQKKGMEAMKKVNKLNEILILVGSGISSPSPANLPLGNALTRFILEASCGEEVANTILDTWDKSKDIIYGYNNNLFFPSPRLEIICGCIYELDCIFNRKSILKGFQSFNTVYPNINHALLAALLKNGVSIFTTNFDLGIENAFVQNQGELSEFELNGIFGYKTNSGSSILHLHGCSNNAIDRLGATMSNVKSGFSEEAKTGLIQLINNAKQVIVLGYGAVDTFDIIPLFQDERVKGNHIIYVKHGSRSQESQKHIVPFYWNRMSSNFSRDSFQISDTTEYLQNFCIENGVFLHAEDPMDNVYYAWEDRFRAVWGYEYTKEEKLINFLAVRYQLGFNPRIVEPVYSDVIKDIERVSNKAQYSHPRIQAYFSMALKDFVVPKSESASIIHDKVNMKVHYINKEHIISLRDECDYYLKKYSDLSSEIDSEDINRIEFIYKLLVDYSEYAYSKAQYVSYIIACLKYKALLGARFKNENPTEPCNRELLLSLEISHFEGVITALLHYMKAINMYNKINSIQDNYNLKLAVDAVHKLSDITGCYFYKAIIQVFLDENEIYLE